MTIGTSVPRLSFNCDGSTKSFPVPLQAYQSNDFNVLLTTPAGVETALVLNSDYSLAPSSTDAPPKWTLTTLAGNAFPTGDVLQIFVNPVQSQQTQYVQGQAFPSLAVQTNMDRLTQMVQRLQDQLNRSIRAPDGDVAPVMLLASAAARASTGLVFDPNGNLTYGVIPSTTFTQALFNAFLLGSPPFAITPQEIAASVTPTNLNYPPGDVRRNGAILDGVTDCVAAMVQACAVGGNISVLGPMALASASLAALPNQAITLKPGTKIIGIPGSGAVITGTTACNVFYSTDVSNIEFQDFFCTGNGGSGVATTATGYFWYIKCTAAATKTANDLKFIRGGLSNFGGLYWVYVDNTAAVSFALQGFVCDGSVFFSFLGNCQQPSPITITATVFGFSGSNTLTNMFTVTDCEVRNCTAYGAHIKNFMTCWSGTIRCTAHHNKLIGFGTGSEFTDDTACYALTAYDFSHGAALPPDEIAFDDNIIDGVRDCGIYTSGPNPSTQFVGRVHSRRNTISGQTSRANSVLPKGGIVYTSTYLGVIEDNIFYNCATDIAVAGCPSTDSTTWLAKNTVQTMPNNGTGLALSGTSGGAVPKIIVDGFRVKAQNAATGTTAISVNATATVGIANLDLLNIDIDGCNTGITVQAADLSVPALGNVRVANVKMRQIGTNNLAFIGCTSVNQRVVLENLTFASMQAGAAGLYCPNMPNLTVRNVVFEDLTSGSTYCWYGGGSTGRLANMQFVNVAAANRYDSSANRMGVDAPGWTGNDNDFVQYLNPTVTGTGGFGTANQKHWTAGWTWDSANAAWAPDVRLTGT